MTRSSTQFGVGLLIFVAGCGLGVVSMVAFGTSPNEAQRQREAPTIAPGLTQVVRQVVSEQERVSCRIEAPVSEIGVPDIDRDPLVVSQIGVEEGQAIKGGDFLFEVSGHPVVAFETSIPFYRDLAEGSTGEDVRALEENLVALDLLGGADTNFEGETSDALVKIFEPLGIASTDFSLANTQSVAAGSVVSSVNQTLGASLTPEDIMMVLTQSSSIAKCSVPLALPVESGDNLSLEVGANRFEGTVTSVAQLDETGFKPAVFEPAEPFGEADTSGEATLIVETETSEEGVLSVPVGALFESPSGGLELRVETEEETKSVPIKVGVVAGGFAEVISDGLAEGDSVQLHSSPPLLASSPTTPGS